MERNSSANANKIIFIAIVLLTFYFERGGKGLPLEAF
jgi:hypothetical protein